MHNRFSLELHQLKKILSDLRTNLSSSVIDADSIWMDAFSTIVDSKSIGSSALSFSTFDIQNIILMLSLADEEIPWEFYSAISKLVAKIPEGVSEVITKDINFITDYEYESIRIAPNGHWQIVWIVDEKSRSSDPIVLDWYTPSSSTHSPVVPNTILDHIASCVTLLRQGLVLPATSILSVILEATLWDALDAKGIPRYREEKTYMPVNWHFKKLSNQFCLRIEGAEKNVKDLTIPAELTGESYNDITFEIRKASFENGDNTVNIYVKVNTEVVDYLASNQVENESSIPIRGLSAAFQRARKEDLECLKVIPKDFDSILVSLRNNLIHLSPQGTFSDPIHIPGGGVINSIEDLKKKSMFIYHLLYSVATIVESVYLEGEQTQALSHSSTS